MLAWSDPFTIMHAWKVARASHACSLDCVFYNWSMLMVEYIFLNIKLSYELWFSKNM